MFLVWDGMGNGKEMERGMWVEMSMIVSDCWCVLFAYLPRYLPIYLYQGGEGLFWRRMPFIVRYFVCFVVLYLPTYYLPSDMNREGTKQNINEWQNEWNGMERKGRKILCFFLIFCW